MKRRSAGEEGARRSRKQGKKGQPRGRRKRRLPVYPVLGAVLIGALVYLASAKPFGANRDSASDSCPTSQVEKILGASLYRGKGNASDGRLGAQIQEVSANGTAANAGLKGGDVVVSCNGTEVTCPKSLLEALSGLKAGSKAVLAADRSGKTVEVSFTWRPN